MKVSGCSTRKWTREVVDLEVGCNRYAIDGEDLDVGNQIHILIKEEIKGRGRRRPRPHTVRSLATAHADSHNTPANGADLIVFFSMELLIYLLLRIHN